MPDLPVCDGLVPNYVGCRRLYPQDVQISPAKAQTVRAGHAPLLRGIQMCGKVESTFTSAAS